MESLPQRAVRGPLADMYKVKANQHQGYGTGQKKTAKRFCPTGPRGSRLCPVSSPTAKAFTCFQTTLRTMLPHSPQTIGIPSTSSPLSSPSKGTRGTLVPHRVRLDESVKKHLNVPRTARTHSDEASPSRTFALSDKSSLQPHLKQIDSRPPRPIGRESFTQQCPSDKLCRCTLLGNVASNLCWVYIGELPHSGTPLQSSFENERNTQPQHPRTSFRVILLRQSQVDSVSSGGPRTQS